MKPDPTDQHEWWRENWQHTKNWGTCSRCGVRILLSHLDGGVCRDRAGCDATLVRRELENLVAAVRTADGLTVMAFASPGLEVRPFGREDIDERGMPRWVR